MSHTYLNRNTLSSGIISLTVGQDAVPYNAHIELLCDCSPYLDRLLQERYSDQFTPEIDFPNDDPDIFVDFLIWAYSDTIRDVDPVLANSNTILRLFQIWTLAGKFEVPVLQERTLTLCRRILTCQPSYLIIGVEALGHAYEDTECDTSALRTLAVEIWIERATKQELQERKKDLPRGFLEDLSLAWLERRETPISKSDVKQQPTPPVAEAPIPFRQKTAENTEPAAPMFEFGNRIYTTPKLKPRNSGPNSGSLFGNLSPSPSGEQRNNARQRAIVKLPTGGSPARMEN